LLAATASPNILLDSLFKDRQSKWIRPAERLKKNNHQRGINLSSFSFISNPEKTILSLAEIAEADAHDYDAKLNFLDKSCDDISPYIVLAIMRQGMLPIFSGGKIYTTIQRVINSVGLRQELKMHSFRRKDMKQDVWAFPLQSSADREPRSLERELDIPKRDKVATIFVSSLNHWLLQSGTAFELSARGRSALERYLQNYWITLSAMGCLD
jgi:hypothetical protein